MSSEVFSLTAPDQNLLRTYPATWNGQLVLACAKCRKKLKKSGDGSPLVDLKRHLKKRGKHDDNGIRIRVINVSCLKMCPKDALTVCTQMQLGRNQCSILRTDDDIDALYQECKAQHNK